MPTTRLASALGAVALTGLAVFGLQGSALAAPGDNCPNPEGKYPPGQCETKSPQPEPEPSKSKEPKPVKTEKAEGDVGKNGKIGCHGEGYKAGSTADCTVYSAPIFLGTLVADANGVIDGSFPVPAGLPLGNHNAVVVGIAPNGARLTSVTPFHLVTRVAAPGTKTAGGSTTGVTSVGGVQLPRTGAEIATISLLGAGLVGGGATALVAGRRRRTA